MSDQRLDQERLHAALGFKRLNRSWAKLEILLGLTGAGAGILLGQWLFSRRGEIDWTVLVASLLLMVLVAILPSLGRAATCINPTMN